MKKPTTKTTLSCRKCKRDRVYVICKIHDNVLCKCKTCGNKWESNLKIAHELLEMKQIKNHHEQEPKPLYELRPRDFVAVPDGSIFPSTEHEIIASNIMKILARTDNRFRPITWDEYWSESSKDRSQVTDDPGVFFQVVVHCISAEQAVLVSPVWGKRKK
jgi:uncharacterized Zn finger protein